MSAAEQAVEDQAYENLMGLLSEYAPEIVAELRDKIDGMTSASYSHGVADGQKENIQRSADEERITFLRGEAKGMVWAYHTVRLNGKSVQVPENPYVHKNIVDGLMNPRKLMR